MSDLDTRAGAATRELLDHSAPDIAGRFAELKRIRTRRTTAKLVAAAAVVALGVGGWQLTFDSGREIEPAPPTPAGVSNGALLGLHDFSGDGTETWGTAYGDLDAHLPTDADTGPLMQFSPDGRTFYYSDDQQRLAAWDLASGTKQVLMPCPERGCGGGAISPDGSSGVFAGNGLPVEANLATGETQPIDLPVDGAGPVALSPDGTRLAFTGEGALWTTAADGSHAVRVHENGTSGQPPTSVAWSPDGERIAFFGVEGGRYTLMVVDADGTRPVEVHDAGCCAGDVTVLPSVTWSPDGTVLAVATSVLGDDTGVHTVRPDGSQWTLRMKGQWSWLSWQPLAD